MSEEKRRIAYYEFGFVPRYEDENPRKPMGYHFWGRVPYFGNTIDEDGNESWDLPLSFYIGSIISTAFFGAIYYYLANVLFQ